MKSSNASLLATNVPLYSPRILLSNSNTIGSNGSDLSEKIKMNTIDDVQCNYMYIAQMSSKMLCSS